MQLHNKEQQPMLSVSCHSEGSSAVNFASIISICLTWHFPGDLSLCFVFGSFFYSHPSPLNFSTDKSVWQVPLARGLRSWLEGTGLPAMEV